MHWVLESLEKHFSTEGLETADRHSIMAAQKSTSFYLGPILLLLLSALVVCSLGLLHSSSQHLKNTVFLTWILNFFWHIYTYTHVVKQVMFELISRKSLRQLNVFF